MASVVSKVRSQERARGPVEHGPLGGAGRAHLFDLMGEASVGLAEATPEGLLLACNKKLVEVYGLSEDKLVGINLSKLLSEEERERFPRLLRRLVAGGPSFTVQVRHVRPDGARVWTTIHVLPWDEARTKLLIVVHDETHWNRTGRELRNRNAQLEERLLEQMKEQDTVIRELESFNYAVSHDLRTPLRAIRGFSELLLRPGRSDVGAESRTMIQHIYDGTRRLNDTVEGLLRLSRMSRQELRRQRIDLSALVKQLLGSMQRRSPRRKARFVVQPNLVAQADPQMIEVVLQNLLENAWKFTRGRLETIIEFGATERDGRAHYFVKDNGVGFDMAEAANLFQPFHRLHKASEFEGTGIGLATVQRIVRRHGGKIEALAVPNEGATFLFTLSRWQNWG